MGDVMSGKKKKSLISKTWERCKSMGNLGYHKSTMQSSVSIPKSKSRPLYKSKSWTGTPRTPPSSVEGNQNRSKKSEPTTPNGCFSVYVGPDKQRFVIKAKCANHPLFRMLLEEAVTEYGYSSMGPLMLPCDVEVFIKVLFEMEARDDYDRNNSGFGHHHDRNEYGCIKIRPKSPKSYRMLSPSTNGMVAMNQLL